MSAHLPLPFGFGLVGGDDDPLGLLVADALLAGSCFLGGGFTSVSRPVVILDKRLTPTFNKGHY